MQKPAAKRVENLLTAGVKSGEPDAIKLIAKSALLNFTPVFSSRCGFSKYLPRTIATFLDRSASPKSATLLSAPRTCTQRHADRGIPPRSSKTIHLADARKWTRSNARRIWGK
jgi:hypothetical protein